MDGRDTAALYLESIGSMYSRSLDHDYTRVLALQPGKANDPLECQIRDVSALAKASYDAISYVWGSQDATESIRCTTEDDGEQVDLPLTRSAAGALRAVRKTDKERLVWIDCICISQTSKEEKAAQVAMMDIIFANAGTVLIWLGVDEKGQSVAAADHAGRIHECFGDETRNRWRESRETVVFKPIDPVARQSCYDGLESVLPLFECELFWRLWCVQELALAKQPIIYWGSVVLDWQVVLSIAAFIETRAPLSVAHTGYAGVHNVIMLECLREQVRGQGLIKRVPFSRLLSLTRLHGVTEPHDRIFSLLGLDLQLLDSRDLANVQYADWWRNGDRSLHFELHIVPLMQPLVTPDYSQGIDRLYLSTAMALLTRERNLHLLSFVQHEAQAGQGDLPSWVPQWHVNKHRLITQFDLFPDSPIYVSLRAALGKSNIESDVCMEGEPDRSNMLAGGAPLDEFVVDADGTLRTQGLLLDTVAKSCSHLRFDADPGHPWLETLHDWYRIVSAWFEQDVQRSLLNVPQDQFDDKVFRMFYEILLGGHFRAKDVFLGLRTERESFRVSFRSGSTASANLFPTTRAFVTQMCRSRTLFLTDGGQLGIGPQCLEPGDCVCFLAGAAIPLLLRPCSSADVVHRHWILVGETYINELVGASLDHGSAEGLEAFPEDDELTQTVLSPLAAAPREQSFLETLEAARVDRAFAMFSNYTMSSTEWGQIYYSDLGKIEVRPPSQKQDSQTLFTSSGRVTSGDPGATDARSYKRMQFNIR